MGHWVKIYFDGEKAGISLVLATVWLGVAFLLKLTFALTFAVAPVGVTDTVIHVAGFAVGLIGYALVKAFAAYKYYMLGLPGFADITCKIYFFSFLFQIIAFVAMSCLLIVSMMVTDLEARTDGPVPDVIGPDHAGNFIVFVAAVGPIIQYMWVPDELRNTAHIIDATQDENTRGELRLVKISDGQMMKWGPAKALIIYDVIFFVNYLVGWILTAIFNDQGIQDNNVTRIYGMYNICIGTDTFPARPICALIFTVSFIFFTWSCYLHWVKIYFDGAEVGISLRLATVWLGVAYLLKLSFAFTFVVAPVGVTNTIIHVTGFAVALTGYALVKAFAAYKYYMLGLPGFADITRKIYFFSFLFQIIAFVVMSCLLILSMMVTDLEARIDGPVPDGIGPDHAGNLIVFCAAVGPIIQYMWVPDELRNTAHIIDATPDTVLAAWPEKHQDLPETECVGRVMGA